MAGSFKGLTAAVVATDIWVPSRVAAVRELFGELRENITLSQANTEIRERYRDIERDDGRPPFTAERGLAPSLTARAYASIIATIIMGALVTAVAGASLTLLLFARVVTNQADTAIRFSLGASRRDITRLLTIEVALLGSGAAVIGALTASVLAHAAAEYFMAISELGVLALDTASDWRVFLFLLAITLLTAFTIVAVLTTHACDVDALAVLASGAGAGGATLHGAPARSRLISSQLAAVTVLLLLAALFARSTLASLTLDHGFHVAGVAIGWLDQTPYRGDKDQARTANRRVLDTIRHAPGVIQTALTTGLPGNSAVHSAGVRTERNDLRWSAVACVTSEFFDVIGLPLRRGRTFTLDEEAAMAPVAVVSESVARTFWPGREALGRRLWFAEANGFSQPVEVIGVVADAQVDSHDAVRRREVFVPFGYRPEPAVAAVIARGAGSAHTAVETLRRVQPTIAFLSSRTLEEELAGTVAAAKLAAVVFGALGFVGLFVALVGVYGVTAQLAVQRRKELSIRKALGATNVLLCRMLLGETRSVVSSGIGPGLAVGMLIAVLLRGSFPNLPVFDWIAMLGVSAILTLTAIAAGLLPFRRVFRDTYATLRQL